MGNKPSPKSLSSMSDKGGSHFGLEFSEDFVPSGFESLVQNLHSSQSPPRQRGVSRPRSSSVHQRNSLVNDKSVDFCKLFVSSFYVSKINLPVIEPSIYSEQHEQEEEPSVNCNSRLQMINKSLLPSRDSFENAPSDKITKIIDLINDSPRRREGSGTGKKALDVFQRSSSFRSESFGAEQLGSLHYNSKQPSLQFPVIKIPEGQVFSFQKELPHPRPRDPPAPEIYSEEETIVKHPFDRRSTFNDPLKIKEKYEMNLRNSQQEPRPKKKDSNKNQPVSEEPKAPGPFSTHSDLRDPELQTKHSPQDIIKLIQRYKTEPDRSIKASPRETHPGSQMINLGLSRRKTPSDGNLLKPGLGSNHAMSEKNLIGHSIKKEEGSFDLENDSVDYKVYENLVSTINQAGAVKTIDLTSYAKRSALPPIPETPNTFSKEDSRSKLNLSNGSKHSLRVDINKLASKANSSLDQLLNDLPKPHKFDFGKKPFKAEQR